MRAHLPSAALVGAVDRLARTTGSDPVPPGKRMRGYRHARDKFSLCGLSAMPGETVAAPRALECPVQIEAKVARVHGMAEEDAVWRGILPRSRCASRACMRIRES
ncbi:flavin reductase (DIM6/NTAB) family NADH-FMN oxidoreductase RutF [Bradyrhizobium sp. AZCC 1708]